MAVIKINEEYDGRLPVYHVVKEVQGCDNCGTREQIVETFDTYEQADEYRKKLVKEIEASYNTTPCGEEDPCS